MFKNKKIWIVIILVLGLYFLSWAVTNWKMSGIRTSLLSRQAKNLKDPFQLINQEIGNARFEIAWALALNQLEKPDVSYSTIDRVFNIYNSINSRNLKANTRVILGKLSKRVFQKIEKWPSSGPKFYILGRFYETQEEIPQAVKAYKQAIFLQPGHKENIKIITRFYQYLDEPFELPEKFWSPDKQKLLADLQVKLKERESPEDYFEVARLYEKNYSYGGFLENTQKAIELSPNEKKYYFYLVRVFNKILSPANKKRYFTEVEKILASNHDRFPRLVYLGELNEGIKKYDTALYYFKEAQKIGPANENLIKTIAEIYYHKLYDAARAIQELKKGKTKKTQYLLARIYYDQKNYNLALPILNDLVKEASNPKEKEFLTGFILHIKKY